MKPSADRVDRLQLLATQIAAGAYAPRPLDVADAIIDAWTWADVVERYREEIQADSDSPSAGASSSP